MTTLTTGKASSFITFSRGSLATVTDADGRIKWAPHNLLSASEQFDASAWTKLNVTVAANSSAAPNGTTTADTLTSSSSVATTTGVYVNTTGLASGHTMSVFVKAGTSNIAWVSGDNAQSYAVFSLSGTGSVLTSANGTPSITPLGSSWFLLTLANTTVSNAFFIIGGKDTYSSGHPWSNGTWTSGNTIFIWGAHLYRSDLGGMVYNPAQPAGFGTYYPTTPPNGLGFTEDFTNAYWNKLNILSFGSGSVSNAAINPVNGLQTADIITPNTTNGTHVVYPNAPLSGNTQTHSVYVKPSGYTKVALREDQTTGASVAFTLVGTGSVLAVNTSGGLTPTNPWITALPNGWYRILTTFSGTASQRFSLYILPDSYTSGAVTGSWTPDGVSGVYIWGAQVSDSASIDPYSPVYGAAVTSSAYYAPRLDYDPVSVQPRGILIEEQRTNLALYSNDFTQSAWTKINLTNVTNKTSGPDAVSNSATLLNEDIVNSEHGISQTFSKAASAITYTLSCFAKVGVGRTRITMAGYSNTESGNGTFAPFDLSGGQTGSISNRGSGWAGSTSSITPVGNGWYRCTLTVTTSTGTDIVFQILNDSGSGTATQARAYAGTVGNGCYIYGAQLEAGSFPTSYIPTAAATVTRNADVASVATSQFPYSASEGTLVAAFSSYLTKSSGVASIEDGTTVNRTQLTVNASSQPSLIVVKDSVGQVNITQTAVSALQVVKMAGAYKANDFALSSQGLTATTSTSGAIPTSVFLLQIGNRFTGEYLNGHIRQITYLPRKLSNADLTARTV